MLEGHTLRTPVRSLRPLTLMLLVGLTSVDPIKGPHVVCYTRVVDYRHFRQFPNSIYELYFPIPYPHSIHVAIVISCPGCV